MENLKHALRIICDNDILPQLAGVLMAAYQRSTITYDEIKKIADSDPAEVLMLVWDFKLLLPRRALRCGEWDDRMLVMEPGEIYEMPNITRYLIGLAINSGKWQVNEGLRSLYKDMGEPLWEKIPALVGKMKGYAVNRIISAPQINAACIKTGITDKTGSKTGAMIAILKGGGVMSPRLAAMGPVARAGAPLYDMNPLVYL